MLEWPKLMKAMRFSLGTPRPPMLMVTPPGLTSLAPGLDASAFPPTPPAPLDASIPRPPVPPEPDGPPVAIPPVPPPVPLEPPGAPPVPVEPPCPGPVDGVAVPLTPQATPPITDRMSTHRRGPCERPPTSSFVFVMILRGATFVRELRSKGGGRDAEGDRPGLQREAARAAPVLSAQRQRQVDPGQDGHPGVRPLDRGVGRDGGGGGAPRLSEVPPRVLVGEAGEVQPDGGDEGSEEVSGI